jgi:hypothetical protein
VEVWGVDMRGYFIQYKFIIPDAVKHSSYTYQKLFRALYGYSQIVTKSNGKTYNYHRSGVLSNTPYIRPGKNCVIIPQHSFQELINFFKTGKNPGHFWQIKGDWKAVYYMDEKELESDKAVKAMENLVDRTYVISSSNEHTKLSEEMDVLAAAQNPSETHKKSILSRAQEIVSMPWFKETHQKSSSLKNFHELYMKLKA